MPRLVLALLALLLLTPSVSASASAAHHPNLIPPRLASQVALPPSPSGLGRSFSVLGEGGDVHPGVVRCERPERGAVVAVFDETGAMAGVPRASEVQGWLATQGQTRLASSASFRAVPPPCECEEGDRGWSSRCWYAPQLRQWIEPDPLGYADSLNRWLFNLGDPINFVDPFGLDAAPTVPDEPPGDDEEEEEGGIAHDEWERAYCDLFPSQCMDGVPLTEEELNDEEEQKILLVVEIVGSVTPIDEAIELAVCVAQSDPLCAIFAILPMSQAILGWARHADDVADAGRAARRNAGNGPRGNGPGGDGPGNGGGPRDTHPPGDGPPADTPPTGGTPPPVDNGCPGGVCPDTCFVAGTLILTADGSAQPIESLAPGDLVLADFCAGIPPDGTQVGVNASELPCVGEARVTDAFVRHATELIHLRVSSPGTGADGVLFGTPEHPFFLLEEAVFVEMGELRPGDLLTDPDGAALVVESVQREVGDFTVYNVGVEGAHDYFVVVGDGTDAVLVHNPRGCGGSGGRRGRDTPDQQALVETVNDATNDGRTPLSPGEADIVLDWADEVGVPTRASPGDVSGGHWIGPHIHVRRAGRGGHVPVDPGTRPR